MGENIDPLRLYATTEVARLLPSSRRGKRLCLKTLYRWRAEGTIQMVRVGNHWFVRGSEVLRLLHMNDPRPMPTTRTEAEGREISARVLERMFGAKRRKAQ